MNKGRTGAPRSTAAHSARLSASRKSDRNQIMIGVTPMSDPYRRLRIWTSVGGWQKRSNFGILIDAEPMAPGFTAKGHTRIASAHLRRENHKALRAEHCAFRTDPLLRVAGSRLSWSLPASGVCDISNSSPMRRLVYLSRFARDLTPADIQSIGQKSRQRNRERGVTGFLVCLGDIFFQVLEGSAEAVMELYSQQILNDDRHKDVVCLRNESFGPIRMFPEWDMNVIDLNDPAEKLPMAFREMAGILMDALYTLNVYSQPTVTRLLEQGINPVHSAPVRKHVTVMFTDLLGFTSLSEKLSPDQALDIVNRHFDTCASVISRNGGEVNKLLGDGLLAYFPQAKIVEAMTAAREIIDAMGKRRAAARLGSVDRVVIAGVGLCYGLVTEGNVGGRSKKEFTIMGRTVNLAARLEALTRELKVPVVMSKELADAASGMYPIRSLGRQPVRGLADGLEVFGFADLDPIDPVQIYSDIDTSFFSR